jgi:hypothetical protein
MLQFRTKILKTILSAPNVTQVEYCMYETIEELIDSDYSNKRYAQYMKAVKSDIFFQMRLKQSRREFNNLTQALKIIQEGRNI